MAVSFLSQCRGWAGAAGRCCGCSLWEKTQSPHPRELGSVRTVCRFHGNTCVPPQQPIALINYISSFQVNSCSFLLYHEVWKQQGHEIQAVSLTGALHGCWTLGCCSFTQWKWKACQSQHIVFSNVFVQKYEKKPKEVRCMGKTLRTNDIWGSVLLPRKASHTETDFLMEEKLFLI